MNRKYLTFIALVLSILYGVGFAIFDPTPMAYIVGGAAVVAIMWIAVGVFGKDEPAADSRGTTQAPPYGTPPQDQP